MTDPIYKVEFRFMQQELLEVTLLKCWLKELFSLF